MVKTSWFGRRKGLHFWKNRSPIFWILLTFILVGLTSVLITLQFEKGKGSRVIPLDAQSRIEQEKAKAQKDFAEFIKTPAGKVWEKHPDWDLETCRKIAAGQVFAGMSKEQVREAVGSPERVRTNKDKEILYEEWIWEGREKIVLEFENNILKSIERR